MVMVLRKFPEIQLVHMLLDRKDYLRASPFADSDIISLNLMGTRVIVLNSASAATELLHNRSAIYSDRFFIHNIRSRLGSPPPKT
jgi:hypothetical protein